MNEKIKARISAINSGIIPAGYKKTKIGIVPVEWEVVRLKSISKHSTEKNKDLKYHETYTNSATQGIIRQTDYFDKQISNNENIDGYYVVKQNDYVYNPRISVSAPCGPIRKSHFAETGVMSPLYTVFRLNDEYEDNEYIEHYLYSPFWHRYMSSVANYGARHDRMNITNEDLFNMPIPFPPLPEQQKIAEILSTQDKLIELQEKKIEKLKELKKGYLQKMFPAKDSKYPELRFRGFTDAWEQRKLGEIVDIGDIDHRMPPTVDNGIPYLMTGDFCGINELNFEGVKQISHEDYLMLSKKIKPEKGDIIFARYASVGSVRYIDFTRDFLISYSCAIIKKGSKINSKYLYHFLTTEVAQKQILLEINTGSQANIGIDSMKNNIIVSMPSSKEQIKISEYFTNLDNLITLHQRKLEQEKQKKKALMQLLLTGKVRVKI